MNLRRDFSAVLAGGRQDGVSIGREAVCGYVTLDAEAVSVG